MPEWQEIWAASFYGNTVGRWVLALVAFLVTFTVLPLVRGYVRARRRRWAQTRREVPLAVEVIALLADRTTTLFLWIVAVYLAAAVLDLPEVVERIVRAVVIVTVWIQAALWAMALVRFGIERRRRLAAEPDPRFAGTIEIILFVAGIAIWAMAALLALANLGYEIGPLLAGLGIGGIAVALAVQTVLGDLLASLSIALDKPFAIGDFLIVDNFMGTVEHIGVKSTRLRSLSGEQIVISNANLLSSRVRNYGRMRERRVLFQIGVTYDTPAEKLRAISAAIREIIEAQPQTRFDRCHFLTYADSALQFEAVYYVLVADYNTYADRQQAINLAIYERFQQLGVQFAFPTRTLHIESVPPAVTAGAREAAGARSEAAQPETAQS